MTPVDSPKAWSPPLVSVILPTYNERENIVPLIQAILKNLAPFRIEILVVDDASPDGTAQTVRHFFSNEPSVHVIVRLHDPGLARSILRGIQETRGDIIIVMDSDGNHQPHYLPFMVEATRYYDCVMGSRFVYGGRMSSPLRHFLSWIFNMFVRCATRGKITDNLYGLFAVRAEHLHCCNQEEIFRGFGEYFIRLLYHFQQLGLNILQFPAINGNRCHGTGNHRFFKMFSDYFIATLRVIFRKRLLKEWPLLPKRYASQKTQTLVEK